MSGGNFATEQSRLLYCILRYGNYRIRAIASSPFDFAAEPPFSQLDLLSSKLQNIRQQIL